MPSAVGLGHDAQHRVGSPLGLVHVVAVVHEQHVDVARVVQLTPSELAHADHRHRRHGRGDRECELEARPARAPASSAPTVRRSASPSEIAAGDTHDLRGASSAAARAGGSASSSDDRAVAVVDVRDAQRVAAQHRGRVRVLFEHGEAANARPR